MGKVNLTVLLMENGQKLGVEEDGKEVVRMIQDFLTKVGAAWQQPGENSKVPQWLAFTNLKRDGSRKLYLREDQVRLITHVSEGQDNEPSNIITPEKPAIVDPYVVRS